MVEQQERVAVITGAGVGIGEGVARRLHADGYRLALHGNSSVDAISALATELGGSTHLADFSDPSAPQSLVDSVVAEHGRLDVLVNNAGAIAMSVSDDAAERRRVSERLAAINLHAPIDLMYAAVSEMEKRNWGRIVNVSSLYGYHGSPFVMPYSVTKAGIDSATRAMAKQAGENGITVNAIAPGNIDTAMTRAAGEEFIGTIIDRTPLGRLGRTDEVAAAVSFFVATEFVTGQVLVIDGGLSLFA